MSQAIFKKPIKKYYYKNDYNINWLKINQCFNFIKDRLIIMIIDP